MRIDEKDYNFDELADASKDGGFKAGCVLITMEKHPERFAKHIRPMIKAENLDVFKLLMQKGKLFNVYDRLDDKKENIWVELVENRQFDFLDHIVDLYSKRPYNIRQMSLLKKALTSIQTDDLNEKKSVSDMLSKIDVIQTNLVRSAALAPVDMMLGSKDEKTDFPDVIFSSYGERSYHFQGIRRSDIRQCGRLSAFLEKMIHLKKSQMIEDIVSVEEKNDWMMDNYSDEAMAKRSLDEIPPEPLTSEETVQQIKEMSMDFEKVYKDEFEKADDLQILFGKVMQSAHAALLQSFSSRGGRIVLQKDEGQEIGVVTGNKVISMKDVTYANLYEGLIQELDGKERVFSSSPLFLSVKKYMQEHETFAQDADKTALLPFLAKRSMVSLEPLPPYLQSVLDVVDVFSKTHLDKNFNAGLFIFSELSQPVHPLTEENLESRLNNILKRTQKKTNGRNLGFGRE